MAGVHTPAGGCGGVGSAVAALAGRGHLCLKSDLRAAPPQQEPSLLCCLRHLLQRVGRYPLMSGIC